MNVGTRITVIPESRLYSAKSNAQSKVSDILETTKKTVLFDLQFILKELKGKSSAEILSILKKMIDKVSPDVMGNLTKKEQEDLIKFLYDHIEKDDTPKHSKDEVVLDMKNHRAKKYMKSGPVRRLIAGYEQRLNEIDYFNEDKENKDYITEKARDFLNDRITKDLSHELSLEERMYISLTIQSDTIEKRHEAEKALKKLGLINLKDVSESVLKNAMDRDAHLQKIESIYKKAGENGQTELTKEQEKLVNDEWKLFDECDAKRISSVQERKNAIKHNENLAKQSPVTWLAYTYLGMPVSGSKR